MLKEALEYTVQLGKHSANVILTSGSEPDHIYFIRQTDGSLEKNYAEPKPEAHSAYNLDSIYELGREHDLTAKVWIDPGSVILVFRNDQRGRAVLPLVRSEPFAQLIAFKNSSGGLTQKNLVRLLKSTFRDTLQCNPHLAESVSKVKFQTGQVINTDLGHGKSSIGKELMGEVTGLGKNGIPEYVKFVVPIFKNPGLIAIHATIECSFDPDPDSGTFAVIPLPNQIEAAIETGVQGVRVILSEHLPDDVKIYFGIP